MRNLIYEYQDIFSVSNDKIGAAKVTKFDIDASKTPPVAVPLRRIPIHQRDVIDKLLEKYMKLDLIEPFDSPYRAAIVLVKKKNIAESEDCSDQYRLCTDYRILNKSIINTAWPPPSIDDCLEATNGSDTFTALDFNSGYHQIPCTTRAKEALAFSPGYGYQQFTWKVMPPGIKSASGTFQRSMCKTFEGHEYCILPPFYDDVIAKGRGFKNHLSNLRIVFEDVRKSGLTLNLLKCSFCKNEIKYLGHIIGGGKIQVDPERVKAITSFPEPKNATSQTVYWNDTILSQLHASTQYSFSSFI